MKYFLFSILTLIASGTLASGAKIYDLKVKTISGKEVAMSEYKGKVLLIVNVASQCGFTPQMKDLQDLYSAYKDKGLVVMAFPSNDFKQEPLSGSDLQNKAQDKYGVSFPIFDKGPVTGPQKQPLYDLLTKSQSGLLGSEVAWNFEKFLVNRQGEVVQRWNSMVSPSSAQVQEALLKALKQPAKNL